MSRDRRKSASRQLGRRAFLKRTLGTGLALPLMPSLLGVLGSGAARAAEAGVFPKRFVVFFMPNGTNPLTWFPTPGATESEFTLQPLHAPLAAFQQQLVLLRGVHLKAPAKGPGEPHQAGMGALLTGKALQEGTFVGGDGSLAGWADGQSVDQRIADVIGTTTARKSLELGVRVNGSQVRHRLSYTGAAQPLPPMTDPSQVFQQLFANLALDPSEAAAVRKRRRSVIDAAQAQMGLVRQKVSIADRTRLDLHVDHLRQLEKQIWTVTELGGACSIPETPPLLNAGSEDMMGVVTRLQIEQLVMALACDITRVASLQVSSAANNIRFPFLYSYADDHVLSHAGASDTTSIDEWAMRQSWYASQFAYMLALMDAVPEGDGTLLDNTLVLFGSELGQGSSHAHTDIPFMLAGGAGGALKGGRYLQYSGKAHNDLLVSCLHAFDIDQDTFGDPELSTEGALTGLMN